MIGMSLCSEVIILLGSPMLYFHLHQQCFSHLLRRDVALIQIFITIFYFESTKKLTNSIISVISK